MKDQMFKSLNARFNSVWITVLSTILFANSIYAQNARLGKDEMKKLSHWEGTWKGEGWQMDRSTRQRIQFSVEEKVESKLGGLALFVEGKGKSDKADFLGHHAIGLIYYNLDKSTYEMKSITQDGMTTLAKAYIDDSGNFIWGFDVPGGQVRFTITLTADTWEEKGAFSMDGNTWYPMMEMNLKKVK